MCECVKPHVCTCVPCCAVGVAQHEYNFFADMAEDDWRYVRRLVVDLVLGTDMAQHTKVCGRGG